MKVGNYLEHIYLKGACYNQTIIFSQIQLVLVNSNSVFKELIKSSFFGLRIRFRNKYRKNFKNNHLLKLKKTKEIKNI